MSSARLIFILISFAALAACAREQTPHRAAWVIQSRIAFVTADLRSPREPAPLESFRLWVPFTAGDLYGAPTSGSYIDSPVQPDYTFTINLNEGHEALVKSLGETAFALGWMRIEPESARIARISPFLMQADGIEPIGAAHWLDEDSGQTLMLVYVDRPAHITGEAPNGRLRFDVQAQEAGYIWIAEPGPEGGVYRSVPQPERLVLAVAPAEER